MNCMFMKSKTFLKSETKKKQKQKKQQNFILKTDFEIK